jgi:hypothetical protein
MRDDINRLAYMNPHFADLYATYGIGGPLIEVGRARYQQYVDEMRGLNLPPLTLAQWAAAQGKG